VGNGIAVSNNDIIRNLTITSEGGNIKVAIQFNTQNWSNEVSFVDIYIDMNNIEGIGATAMLKGIKGFIDSNNAWEYAIRVYKDNAHLYKDSPNGNVDLGGFSVNNGIIYINNKFIRGNPQNWAVQAIAVKVDSATNNNIIVDFLGRSIKTPKKTILAEQPFEISAIKVQKK
jgi:hypothetical protein